MTTNQALSLREEIARIIDAYAWQTGDQINWQEATPSARHLQQTVRKWKESSLLQADAILALALPEGSSECVLVPRVPTEAMVEAYCAKNHELGFTSWVNLSTWWPVVIDAAPDVGSMVAAEPPALSDEVVEKMARARWDYQHPGTVRDESKLSWDRMCAQVAGWRDVRLGEMRAALGQLGERDGE